jgi:hypothetical protein
LIHPDLPNLSPANSIIVSPQDTGYNCIAWAAEDPGRWWWPLRPYFWPANAPREVTIDAFVLAFSGLGFGPCSDGSLEADWMKVALYCDPSGKPTHMARQLPDGRWTSKLGKWHDITHNDLLAVEGPGYGTVRLFLRRPSV